MTDKTKDKGGIINLADKIKAIGASNESQPDEIEQALEIALDTFEGTLADAKGFITITFDQLDQPSIVHAGDLDLLKALGALEFIKNEFLSVDYGNTELDGEQ